MNKILRYSFIALLALVCQMSFADTYTYTFEAKQFSAASQTKNLGGINWTLTTDAGYFGYATAGQQFGSKKAPAKSLELSTSEIPGNISSIKVETFGAASIAATLNVKVGETAFGEAYTLTSTSTETEFTGKASGKISLTYTQKTAKAIYIKSITIVTDGKIETTPEEIKAAANIAAFKALGNGTKATLTLKDAKVEYVNGTSDYYIVDETGGIDIYKPTGLTYQAGQVLNGTITATYEEYYKLPQLTNITENKLTATDGIVTPIEMSVEDAALAENACKLVKITNVKAVKIGTNYYTDENKTIQFYDKFQIGYTVNTENECDYTGIIIPYNTQMELAPTVTPVTSNINGITIDDADANAPVYNLAGQKVSESYKGVVIKAGKKFVQK